MIKRIEGLLKQNKDISAYLVTAKETETIELFYVLKNLETNRATNYSEYNVTVYKDFDKFRGSSSFKASSSLTDEEIKEKIKDAVFAASFVKNLYHDLPQPEEYSYQNASNLALKPLIENSKPIVDAIFKADCYSNGWINSTEIFLSHNKINIINSNNINVSYDTYRLMVEVIPTWAIDKVEVELYKSFEMPEVDLKRITLEVDEILSLAKARSEAKSIPENLNCKVILQDEEVQEIFKEFARDLNYSSIYRHMSLSEIGKSVQGEDISGDKIDITLTPNLKGSIYSNPVDSDGVVLKDVKLIEDGIAKNSYGSYRIGYYLGIKNPTGELINIIAKTGSKSFEQMKEEPYILCVSFSGMQLDLYSGFFGGEVRLGFYFDGENVTPVTGFSISGNIHESKKNLIFSAEETIRNGYKGPKYIEIKDMNIL